MKLSTNPIVLERAVTEDERADIAALPECSCLPTMFTRIAVQEDYSERFAIFRCTICRGIVPAREIERGTCDVRPAELDA